MKVYKRNGAEQDFCLDKIENAIKKANSAVSEEGRLTDDQFNKVVATVEKFLEPFDTVKVEDIQDLVEKALMKHNRYEIAKAYIIFRDKKQNQKLYDDVDEKVLAITKGKSDELRGDNANKHIDVNSSIRDYIAGTECKSLAEKMLDKAIINAHKKGLIHYHDMDYSPVMPLHNCDIFNIEDMLDNGFMMNDTKITRPRRFSTAANLAAQINLIISGSQYGGQTFSWAPLAKYVESTRVDCKIELLNVLSVLPKAIAIMLKPWYNKMVEVMVKRDIHVGIKTYQYQVLCHQSSNGQTPFVSNALNLREAMGEREQKDLAFIIEEILKRRTKGVLDRLGKPMPPLFPKLLYYTCDGLNVKKKDPYYYLTKLAAKCIAVRMQPDIISEKKNREVKKGQMIPCMGCLSGDTNIRVLYKNNDISDTFENVWGMLSKDFNVEEQFGIKDNPNKVIKLQDVKIWDNKENSFVECSQIIRNDSTDWIDVDFYKVSEIGPDVEFSLEKMTAFSKYHN